MDPTLAVRIPVRPVLNLVCRALAVSCKSIVSQYTLKKKQKTSVLVHHLDPFSTLFSQNSTGDGNVRLLILPMVHLNVLEVLSALIIA